MDRKKVKVQDAQQEVRRVRKKGERENITPLIFKETEIVKDVSAGMLLKQEFE